ncbi:MAG: RNA polymerase sigma factor [Candidatus Binatia bacterium]
MEEKIQELLQRAAAGERHAWEAVVNQYGRLVWSLLYKFDTFSRTEREDLFQDVFVILLHRGLQHFHGSTVHEFRSYLKTITENEAKSYLRRHGRRFEVLDAFLANEREEETPFPGSLLADPAPGPEELVARQELFLGLCRCLRDISALDQEVFWRRERGHSYQEITVALGLAQGTVASKYHRAKAKLEECLRKAGIL